MSNPKYVKGAVFERKVKKIFQALGFRVTRGAGSKGDDLTAVPLHNCMINTKRSIIIEAKKYADYKPKPTDEFKALKIHAFKLWVSEKKYSRNIEFDCVN